MTSDTDTYILPAPIQSCISDEGHATPLPTRYLELAHQIVIDAGVKVSFRLILIVRTALAAIHLLFTAALHEPAEPELDVFFETFVRACVPPSSSGGQQ